MDELQDLLDAFDHLRSELPDLVGSESDRVEKAMQSYRDQRKTGHRPPEIVRAMILKFLSSHPKLFRRLQEAVAAAKGETYRGDVTRGLDDIKEIDVEPQSPVLPPEEVIWGEEMEMAFPIEESAPTEPAWIEDSPVAEAWAEAAPEAEEAWAEAAPEAEEAWAEAATESIEEMEAEMIPDEESGGAAKGISPAVQPGTVTRYTDINCPRQVWVETPRFPVSVRLTRKVVAHSAAKVKMAVRTDLPVTITIEAPGFEILGDATRHLDVPAGADSDWVTFMLKPQAAGSGAVILEFRQAGNLAGTAAIPITISATEVEAIPALSAAPPLKFEAGAPPDRTLVIGTGWKDGRHQLTFRLYEGATLREEFPPRPLETSVESYVTDLYGQLTHHADQAAGFLDEVGQAEAERLIRQIGRKLWRTLLPQQLRALYLAEWQSWQDSTFLIVSDEPNLPWELVWPYAREWDGPDDPWCLTLQLARWLRRTESGDGVPGPTTRLRWQRFSAIVPSDTQLPFAQQEWGILRQVMQIRGMEDCSPAHFALADVLNLFEKGKYDWVHAATHGSFRGGDPGRRSTLSLSDRETLSPDDLLDPKIETHLWNNRPGIVFNTCDSGRMGWGLTGAGGWASQFIGSGAAVFLAAQWSVTDKQALAFAERFYKSLGDGESAAQAVRTARRAARRDGDPTWLAYSLYAHPAAVVTG